MCMYHNFQVTCTALLYLAGYGLPAVVDSILSQSSNFSEQMKKDLQESLKELEETRTKYKNDITIASQQVADCSDFCENRICCCQTTPEFINNNVCDIPSYSICESVVMEDCLPNASCDSTTIVEENCDQSHSTHVIVDSRQNYNLSPEQSDSTFAMSRQNYDLSAEGCVGDENCCVCKKMHNFVNKSRSFATKVMLDCGENVSMADVEVSSSVDQCNGTETKCNFNHSSKQFTSNCKENVKSGSNDTELNMACELQVYSLKEDREANSIQMLKCCCHCQHSAGTIDNMTFKPGAQSHSTSNKVTDSLKTIPTGISSKTVSKIFKPNLVSLNIQKIEMVSVLIGNEFLKKFIDSNPGLQQLWLEWDELDNMMLDYICSHLTSLRSIRLMDCRALGTPAISSLGRQCTDLVTVDLQGNQSILNRY